LRSLIFFFSIMVPLGLLVSCSAKHPPKSDFSVAVHGDAVTDEQQNEMVAAKESIRHKTDNQIKPSPESSGEEGKSDAKQVQNAKKKESVIPAHEDEASKTRGAKKLSDSPAKNNSASSPASEVDPGPAEETGEPIVFNFENAALSEVIRNLAQQLEINYMFDVAVEGKVTIHTTGKLYESDLWPLFFQILEANGLTAVKKEKIYHVVNLKNAARMPITSHVGGTYEPMTPNENMIIQIISLQYITAQEMTKILTPFISETGQIVSHNASNTLLVVDNKVNMPKVLKIVNSFDINVFQNMKHRFFPLDYVGVDEVVKTLNEIFTVYSQSGSMSKISFIGLSRLNTVLALSSAAEQLEKVAKFVETMDVPSQGNEPKIYVYSVENGQAGDIAKLLTTIFSGKSAKKTPSEKDETGVSRNPFAMEKAKASDDKEGTEPQNDEQPNAQKPGPAEAAPVSGGNDFSSGTLRGEVKITPDETRNNIIIEAIPSDYRIVRDLLKEVDVLPRQVLIKMTIAEVSLDERTEMGVEWSYVKGDENLSTSLLDASLGGGGFRYSIGKTDRWTSALSALASQNKVNILSSPSVLASNSKDAQIDITTEVPVASSNFQYTSGENPVVEQNIHYRDTGVILSVTPNINEVGLVTMEIESEISEQADNVQVGDSSFPSFFKRSAETTLTVKSGQTIVIGGLIKETTSKGSSGAPWFVDLPVLNFIFGQKNDSLSKTELIIFISPSVITDLEDVEAVTDEFKQKVRHIIPENL